LHSTTVTPVISIQSTAAISSRKYCVNLFSFKTAETYTRFIRHSDS